MIISLLMLLCYQMEYEINIYTFTSLFETFYYIAITMTTCGYGDMSARSYFGQNSMVVATCFGVAFEGMFLIAWARYCDMT